jgi:hypothetical protein
MIISEATLPEGFPPPGPVGTAVVKTYPAHRLARTMAARDGDDRMFMKLFRHIERHDIAMTAPVTMAWSDAAATPARGGRTRASPGQRPAGPPLPAPASGAAWTAGGGRCRGSIARKSPRL